jgi:putative multiple sugar transport system substrate-binding protein
MSAKRNLGWLAAASGVALMLSSCNTTDSSTSASASGPVAKVCNVGIAMPTRSLERWISDGENLQALLKADGCTVDLQYADNKTDQQISQLQNMIANGATILVIASIDGTTLGPVLADAGAAGVTVIAYDRLINGSPNVDYYATFDNLLVGTLQGQFLEEKLGLKDGKGPFFFEPFAGSPDDNNAKFFFTGAWTVLSPYVDSGKLVIKSGKSPKLGDDSWKTIGILGWGSDDAQAEMENRLGSFYTTDKVNVVLSPNDSLAQGIAAALAGAGYTPAVDGKYGVNWPWLDGQDGDKASVINMLAGKQSMTVWKDTRELGKRVHEMIKSIIAGTAVETNDTTTYNNDVKVVPSYLVMPEVVTPDQIQTKLIDSGFLKASDVGL